MLHWLAGALRVRVVLAQGQGEVATTPLFERYLLARACGCGLFLHHYLRADPARGLHDHPARWAVALVLAGEYAEFRRRASWRTAAVVLLGAPRVRVPRFSFFTHDTFHRIASVSERGTWSLFLMGPRAGGWGFADDVAGMQRYRPVADDPGAGFDWSSAPRGRAIARAPA